MQLLTQLSIFQRILKAVCIGGVGFLLLVCFSLYASQSSNVPESCLAFNLIYVKVPKTGSSTTGGVARRVGAHHCLHGVNWEVTYLNVSRGNTVNEPFVLANHWLMRDIRNILFPKFRMPSFVFTVIRDPMTRCRSSMYYVKQYVSPGVHLNYSEVIYTDTHFVWVSNYTLSRCLNYQYNWMAPFAGVAVSDLFHTYDFIGVIEREDQSFAMLAHLLGIPISDVLHINSKVSGACFEDDFCNKNLLSSYPSLSQESPRVQALFSTVFRKLNNLDYELYSRAIKQLDQASTPALEKSAQSLKEANQQAASLCSSDCILRENGCDCYWKDNGCGYTCLDSIVPA